MTREATMRAIARQCKLVLRTVDKEDEEGFDTAIRALVEELEFRLDNSHFNCPCGKVKKDSFYKMAVDIAS